MKKMKRDLLPWAFILFLSLGLAYWASIPVSETSTSKVAIVTIPESTISTIELSAPDSKVLAKRRSDINDRWWISSERKGQAASAGQIESSATNERFMASAKFKDMLAQLSPFQALRVIGKVSDEQLQEFGLRDSLKSMIIKDSAGASPLSLLIGKQLYGSRNHYVLNQADQKVLLVSGDFINDFLLTDTGVLSGDFFIMDISPRILLSGCGCFTKSGDGGVGSCLIVIIASVVVLDN